LQRAQHLAHAGQRGRRRARLGARARWSTSSRSQPCARPVQHRDRPKRPRRPAP
jgi:hypothetical protein